MGLLKESREPKAQASFGIEKPGMHGFGLDADFGVVRYFKALEMCFC